MKSQQMFFKSGPRLQLFFAKLLMHFHYRFGHIFFIGAVQLPRAIRRTCTVLKYAEPVALSACFNVWPHLMTTSRAAPLLSGKTAGKPHNRRLNAKAIQYNIAYSNRFQFLIVLFVFANQ